MTSFVIVDDHPKFRALARLLLEQEGYDVVGEAADAASGLTIARELAPDVVLLDVHLPDASGFDLAGELTRAGSPPAVVMTSTHDGSDFETLTRRSGARGFVSKDDLSGPAISALLA